MNFKNFIQLACTTIVAVASAGAHATTVNFEDQSLNFFNTRFDSDGFNFANSGLYGYAVTTSSNVCSPACPVSGSMELLMPYGSSVVVMTSATGGAFSLGSFKAAGTFDQNNSNDPTTITVAGLLASGGTVSESFSIVSTGSGSLPFTLETANASFADVTSLTFTSSGAQNATYNGFTLDDITVGAPLTSAVPESSSIAMLLAGLGVLGVAVRRRQSRA